MTISILGANGFLGRKLTAALAASGTLGGRPVGRLTLFDVAAAPTPPAAFPIDSLAGDIADLPPGAIPAGTTIVFQLAAIVSAAAEADYDLGRRVNLGGLHAVIDACRALAAPPRLVFTSSVASFSGGQNSCLADDARQRPTNSYGAQKAIGEMLLTDASRRGFLDAVSLRLPTVIIRPGRPNLAASSFASAVLREPLLGLPAVLPVADGFALWVCSPRRAVAWLLHAASMDTAAIGQDRSINPPGLRATIGAMLAALEAARPGAAALVRRAPDPAIAAIVGGWPAAFDPTRALGLGFAPQEPLDRVIAAFVADDLAATRRDRL